MKLPFGLPMPPKAPVRPPSTFALYLVFFTTALALTPHLLRQPAWLSAITLAIVLWRVVIALRGGRLPPAWLRVVLSVVMIALVVGSYHTIFGRVAGSALLVSFTALKVLETRSLRDAMFCNILVTIVVLAAFLFDQSPASAAYGLACLVLVAVSFVVLVAPGTLPVSGAFALTGRVLLLGVPLALAAYVLFPRIEGSLWGMADDPLTAVSGLSDEIAPGSVSRLNLDDTVAFRVDFDGPAPPRRELYWRMAVLERFDGHRWSRAEQRAPAVTADAGDAAPYHYTVTLEASDQRWLPVLELPLGVEDGHRLNALGLARARHRVDERLRYRASSSPARFLDVDPGEVPSLDAAALGDEVRALAQQLAADGGTADEVAARILDHFREQPFYYTLTPPAAGERPLHDFLFESRRGYCEHYASAFAALMRAAGFDARVVLGYQGGEQNPSGGYYIVRQWDAHAWAEVHVAGRGWMRVDPTAAVAPERVEVGLEALRRLASAGGLAGTLDAEQLRQALRLGWWSEHWRQLRMIGDAFTHQWNTWVMAYGPEQQQLLLSQLGIDAPRTTSLLIGLGIAVAVFMGAIGVLLSARGRQRQSPARQFRRFCAKLRRAGFSPAAGEGPVDLAQRAMRQFPGQSAEIAAIADEYTALVYAPPGRASLARLRSRVGALHLRPGPAGAQ